MRYGHTHRISSIVFSEYSAFSETSSALFFQCVYWNPRIFEKKSFLF